MCAVILIVCIYSVLVVSSVLIPQKPPRLCLGGCWLVGGLDCYYIKQVIGEDARCPKLASDGLYDTAVLGGDGLTDV